MSRYQRKIPTYTLPRNIYAVMAPINYEYDQKQKKKAQVLGKFKDSLVMPEGRNGYRARSLSSASEDDLELLTIGTGMSNLLKAREWLKQIVSRQLKSN